MTTRYVLVTGASKGIGKATALHLDKLGFHVFAGVRKETDAEMLRSEATERLQTVFIDVTNSKQITAAAEQITQIVGETGLYGLVNNAGMGEPAPLEFIGIERLRHQLEVNVVGQLAVTQSVLPLIRKAKGRIINISSIAGRIGALLNGPYSMSKFALEAMSDVLRLELEPWGIEVVSIEPGAIATDIWETTTERANERLAEFPEETLALYQDHIDAGFKWAKAAAERAIPAQVVADTIEKALTAKRPKTRYLVGPDAKFVGRLRTILPDRWLDFLVKRM